MDRHTPPTGSRREARATQTGRLAAIVTQTAPIIRIPDSDPVPRPGETARKSCLVRIYPAGVSGSLISLKGAHLTIGRESDSDIELPDDFISRHHAVIEQVDGHFRLTDCRSLNGTFVNDIRIEQRILVPGDQIRLGNHILKFLSADHVEAQYHETVYQMMTVDALTNAHNKRYFEDVFARELLRTERHSRPLALLLLDIDHFKPVNDQYGHLVGDECLRQFSIRVQERVRGEDLFARFGGEEFALMLAETNLKQAVRVAQDIRQLIQAAEFRTSKGTLHLTVSIGVGFTSGQGPVGASEVIEQADGNLYRAKRDGRNCIRF